MFRSSVSNEAIYLAQSIPGPFDGALPEAISDAASIREAVPETIEALEVQTDTMVSAAQEVGMTISASRLPYAPYLHRPETSGRVVSILAAGSPGRPFDRQPVSTALHDLRDVYDERLGGDTTAFTDGKSAFANFPHVSRTPCRCGLSGSPPLSE